MKRHMYNEYLTRNLQKLCSLKNLNFPAFSAQHLAVIFVFTCLSFCSYQQQTRDAGHWAVATAHNEAQNILK